jgi:hypothetical protein
MYDVNRGGDRFTQRRTVIATHHIPLTDQVMPVLCLCFKHRRGSVSRFSGIYAIIPPLGRSGLTLSLPMFPNPSSDLDYPCPSCDIKLTDSKSDEWWLGLVEVRISFCRNTEHLQFHSCPKFRLILKGGVTFKLLQVFSP